MEKSKRKQIAELLENLKANPLWIEYESFRRARIDQQALALAADSTTPDTKHRWDGGCTSGRKYELDELARFIDRAREDVEP